MNALHVLLLLFIAIPLAEIYLLIEVGGVIGVVPTIGLVVLTAVAGAALVRAQGFSTIRKVRRSMDAGEVPAIAIIEGIFLLLAGALLLTPGFLTDAIGFCCLVPPLRRAVIVRFIESRMIRMRESVRASPPRTCNRREVRARGLSAASGPEGVRNPVAFDVGRFRPLARLRLGPTRHARRPFLAPAGRAPPTHRSLVPSRRKPLPETWLTCEDRRRSRHLARLRLEIHDRVPMIGTRLDRAPIARLPAPVRRLRAGIAPEVVPRHCEGGIAS